MPGECQINHVMPGCWQRSHLRPLQGQRRLPHVSKSTLCWHAVYINPTYSDRIFLASNYILTAPSTRLLGSISGLHLPISQHHLTYMWLIFFLENILSPIAPQRMARHLPPRKEIYVLQTLLCRRPSPN